MLPQASRGTRLPVGAQGVRVVHDAEQDTNDLEKSLRHVWQADPAVRGRASAPALTRRQSDVVVISSGGGRFDQAVANLSALYRCAAPRHAHRTPHRTLHTTAAHPHTRHPSKRLRFVLDHSLVFLLPAGRHTVHIDNRVEGPLCGLLPLGAPVRSVSTRGLRWNVGAPPALPWRR